MNREWDGFQADEEKRLLDARVQVQQLRSQNVICEWDGCQVVKVQCFLDARAQVHQLQSQVGTSHWLGICTHTLVL